MKNDMTGPSPSFDRKAPALRAVTQIFSERAAHFLTGISLFLLLLMSMTSPKGAAILFGIAVISGLAVAISKKYLRPLRSEEWILLVFFLYAGLSCLWSPDPRLSATALPGLLGIVAGGSLIIRFVDSLDPKGLRIIRTCILLGGAIGYILLGTDLLTQGSLYGALMKQAHRPIGNYLVYFKPAVTVGAVLFWPWALIVAQSYRRTPAFLGIGLACLVLLNYRSDTAAVAIVAGIAAGGAVVVLRTRAARVITVISALFILSSPFLAQQLPDPTLPGSHLDFLPNSAIHRVDIWRTTARRIFEDPWFGHGFDSSRMLYGPETSRSIYLVPDAPEGPHGVLSEPIPLHPHNSVLQIWLELGFAGAVLLIVFLAIAYSRVMSPRLTRSARFIATAYVFSALVVASASFGAWQSWWLSVICLTAFALRAALRETQPFENPSPYTEVKV